MNKIVFKCCQTYNLMEEFEPEYHELEPIEEEPKGPIKKFIDKYWKAFFTVLVIFMLIFWFFRI